MQSDPVRLRRTQPDTRSFARTLDVLHATKALGLADDDDVNELWLGTEATLHGDAALAVP